MENLPNLIERLHWLFIKDKTPIDFLVDSVENFELLNLTEYCTKHGYYIEILDKPEISKEQGHTRVKFTKLS